MQDLTGATATTFHDVLNPLRNERVSLRIDRGHVTEQASSLAPDRGRNVDGSALWLLPSLYDADSQYPRCCAEPRAGRADGMRCSESTTAHRDSD